MHSDTKLKPPYFLPSSLSLSLPYTPLIPSQFLILLLGSNESFCSFVATRHRVPHLSSLPRGGRFLIFTPPFPSISFLPSSLSLQTVNGCLLHCLPLFLSTRLIFSFPPSLERISFYFHFVSLLGNTLACNVYRYFFLFSLLSFIDIRLFSRFFVRFAFYTLSLFFLSCRSQQAEIAPLSRCLLQSE